MAKERIRRGCKCRCGQTTYSTYAPGHDSKHVANMVSWVVSAEAKGLAASYEWRKALEQLGSFGLQCKFRRSMYKLTQRNCQFTIDRMNDAHWQKAINLNGLLAEADWSWFSRGPMRDPRTLATYAAAMGWTRSSVNMRRS